MREPIIELVKILILCPACWEPRSREPSRWERRIVFGVCLDRRNCDDCGRVIPQLGEAIEFAALLPRDAGAEWTSDYVSGAARTILPGGTA